MSYGMKIWNSAGQLTHDISDRLGRYHATITLGNIGPQGSANYPVPGYALDGTWFIFIRAGTSVDSYLQISEQANNINVFNTNYSTARGSGVFIDVFRG